MKVEIINKTTKETYAYYENMGSIVIEDNVVIVSDPADNIMGCYSLTDFTFKAGYYD